MSETKELTLAETEELRAEVVQAISIFTGRALAAGRNVEDRADVGPVRRGDPIVRRHELENALQDAQEVLGRLLPHLPK